MTPAAAILLALVLGLFVYDAVTLRGPNKRALFVEALAFVVGGFFIAAPSRATALANAVGIGRGVDFLLYPIVIWLVRESLLTRRRRVDLEERLTELVRALALLEARELGGGAPEGAERPTPAEPPAREAVG